VQVGLPGVIESEEDDQKDGATEPSKPLGQKIERGRAALRGKPEVFVGEIDDSCGHGANEGRETEGDEGGEDGIRCIETEKPYAWLSVARNLCAYV
jgi:hypothetical protein